jgi:hypothetical protein
MVGDGAVFDGLMIYLTRPSQGSAALHPGLYAAAVSDG